MAAGIGGGRGDRHVSVRRHRRLHRAEEAHGDEQAADLVAEFFEAVSDELPSWGATHVKTIGDAHMLRIPDPAQAVLLGLRITHELPRGQGTAAGALGMLGMSSK